MKSPTPEANSAKGFFQIKSPICGVNISITGQGQWEEKLTWLDLWNLLTINIISPHDKTSLKKFAQKCLFHKQSFIAKNVPPYFAGGRGDTAYLQIPSHF